jgi:ABC-type nickel/cobalt efflux system permease component RcnA
MDPSFTSVGVLALLGLGLMFGLKHATEVDHVVAVSTIVSEHRNVLRSALVGGLWGAGHTASLVIIGFLVLVFRVTIPLRVANWLEFGVALMIIALGVLAVLRVLRKRPDVHLHRHSHDGQSHVHIHFHEHGTEHRPAATSHQLSETKPSSHSHAISQVGFKPLLVGAMHGLAGSAALTLLVLTQIQSVLLGLFYLALFGIGSTVGMLLMSGMIGLPFVLSGRRLTSINYGVQTAAGCLSIAFGLWYAYATAFRFH